MFFYGITCDLYEGQLISSRHKVLDEWIIFPRVSLTSVQLKVQLSQLERWLAKTELHARLPLVPDPLN